jgi:hypothetical protein
MKAFLISPRDIVVATKKADNHGVHRGTRRRPESLQVLQIVLG